MGKTERFWDLFSYKYDEITRKAERTRIVTIEKTRKYLTTDDHVLDYACGTGIFAVELAKNVKDVCAIDISLKMLEAAKNKAEAQGIRNIYFAHLPIFADKFQRDSFDIILAFNILHLLKDTNKHIRRINELLKAGGFFISSTECGGERKKSFVNVLASFLSSIGIVPHISFFTILELENAITRGNFHIVESDDFHTLSQPNHFIVAQKA
jgi:ubiquinone/menaquinone biosynthesis C-methylase UbiE